MSHGVRRDRDRPRAGNPNAGQIVRRVVGVAHRDAVRPGEGLFQAVRQVGVAQRLAEAGITIVLHRDHSVFITVPKNET